VSWSQQDKIIVSVDPDLIDLAPGFLEKRKGDIQTISVALKEKDFETIRILGHSMKGAGGGYGFQTITDIGNRIEQAAREMRSEEIENCLRELSSYLSRVEVVEQRLIRG
jgi:HPt (histidine-containing phosphotransfer) domain-containing protein